MRFPARLSLTAGLLATSACAPSATNSKAALSGPDPAAAAAPSPDPRIGLLPGLFDAGEATWNLRVISKTAPPEEFVGGINSDLAFTGKYAIQGNFSGFQVWDISDPSQPSLVRGFVCPASQSDVSVYQHLLFVSGEGFGGRLDCGTEGVKERVSPERLRGIRIFDISDILNPRYVGNVQTCRGSHTHSLLVDPTDAENVYIYVSGSAPVRPATELAGCSGALPDEDPNSALFRIEVIKVPLARPEQAAIVSSPRIFSDLVAPQEHGMAPDDIAAIERAREGGAFVVDIGGDPYVLPPRFTDPLLDSIAITSGRTAPTAADSMALREALPAILAEIMGDDNSLRTGPTQCHDITLFPSIGLGGGACEGYGFLIDIRDPVNPRRLTAVADSNFSYWHSATFNNDGTTILFSDEWGGGGGPKCRASDPKEWGADAIFSIADQDMKFRSYYKLPVPQTPQENCVAHNGSLIPIPGRDVMVQAWYQGGISIFDFTDPARPQEIAFFDRGPADSTRLTMAGTWSAYWYNGVIVSSEIVRGLDILELLPSAFLSQNEIDAAKSLSADYFNAQAQQRFVWPPSFALTRAHVDQLERAGGLAGDRIASVRRDLATAERASGTARREALTGLAARLEGEAGRTRSPAKVRKVASTLRDLATATR
jgi:hypothetical protein